MHWCTATMMHRCNSARAYMFECKMASFRFFQPSISHSYCFTQDQLDILVYFHTQWWQCLTHASKSRYGCWASFTVPSQDLTVGQIGMSSMKCPKSSWCRLLTDDLFLPFQIISTDLVCALSIFLVILFYLIYFCFISFNVLPSPPSLPSELKASLPGFSQCLWVTLQLSSFVSILCRACSFGGKLGEKSHGFLVLLTNPFLKVGLM